ncbi:tyrosine protein phosphatase [Enterovirga sp.]|uniref:tyrosine phosphatase family protein n=1 Tax=Enterovirga sp. TaxID=2026350 RepID=UPI002C2F3B9D|nr:tyrosine protein phosphatase [Enterovirga sp.]HMO27991.1 tyrosine protein phosphatase [Enterovirga sp.]
MSRLLVCPTAHAAAVAQEEAPSHEAGFAAPGDLPAPPRANPAGTRRLDLVFHDIAEPRPGLLTPARADIAALLAFGRSWDEARPLLLHCRMGISRSTAGALILAAAARPGTGEERLAAALRAAAPCATPNARMIALADDLLGRSGRLIAAVCAIGRGADYAPYRMLALDLPARD